MALGTADEVMSSLEVYSNDSSSVGAGVMGCYRGQ